MVVFAGESYEWRLEATFRIFVPLTWLFGRGEMRGLGR